MKRERYWSTPKKAAVVGAKDAWWYANERGVEIHLDPSLDAGHIIVRLTRGQLKAYVAKSGK